MRRQDLEAWPKGACHSDVVYIIKSMCARQKHVIHIRRDGQVIFVSHGNMTNPAAILTEGRIREWQHRGCYFFADFLVMSKSGLHSSNFVRTGMRRGKRYTGSDLKHAGLSSEASSFFVELLKRKEDRVQSRLGVDPYKKPFRESHYSRIMPFFDARQKREQALLARLTNLFKDQGISAELYWNRPYQR